MFKTGTCKNTPDQTENTNSKKSRIESISKPHFLEMIKKFNLDPQEKKGKKTENDQNQGGKRRHYYFVTERKRTIKD